jgi:hypothetical protein
MRFLLIQGMGFLGNIVSGSICILYMLYGTFITVRGNYWWAVLPVAAKFAATIGGYTYNARKIRMVEKYGFIRK